MLANGRSGGSARSWLGGLGAALLALPWPAPAAQAARPLTSAQMEDDLALLYDSLSSLHPGLHRYTSGVELDDAFGAVLLAAGQGPRDVLWFYREVARLVALVRCGHTGVELGPADARAALARKGLLPLEIRLSGKRAWVVRALAPELVIEPGTEILSIEGMSIGEIRERAFVRMSADGVITSGKERELEADFARLFALLADDHETHERGFELETAGSGGPLSVPALAPEDYEARRTPPADRPLLHLELAPEDGLAILDIRAFADPRDGPRFPEALAESFRALREAKIAHLVLDLRGNGGGRDQYGALLVSYLTDRPFGYFERIEVTPDYQGSVEIVERDGRRLMMSHSGLAVQQAAELRFTGDVHVLIDGGTFSTAADVATVLHHNHLATFVGEETGGGYDGNTSGDSRRIVLPASGLTVGIPMWMYTTANLGHAFTGQGVPPDLLVSPTVEDVLAGRDLALSIVRDRIRKADRER